MADITHAAGLMFNPFRLLRGPAIRRYEAAFARRIGVRYAYSFSAGRVGFYALLRALDVGPGDEVLLQVPTHIVVPNAIRYTGAQPVYVDCRLQDYNMDLELAQKKISSRTKALVLQHTFGIPADLEKALTIAREHGITVIEDCVHALGSRYNRQPVGSFGQAAFFSTEETKTITSTMGGMVVTDDRELAHRIEAFQANCPWPSAWLTVRYLIKLILYHVLTEPHLHVYTRALYEMLGRRQPIPGATSVEEQRGARPPGYTKRLANAQAAVSLRQLLRLDSNIAARRWAAAAYAKQLAPRGFRLPQTVEGAEPAYVRYPVCVENRAAAQQLIAPHAVVGLWFTSVLEEAVNPVLAGYTAGSCPIAERVAKELINLPTHSRVIQKDIEDIAQALADLVPEAVGSERASLRSQPGRCRLGDVLNG